MLEKIYDTDRGPIHYLVGGGAAHTAPELVFLPGLTADHRLFEKQIAFFEGKYPVFVWDAPGHAASWPFDLCFSLADKARWLEEILQREGFHEPVIIGQSMGGYVGQMYAQLFPERLKGFISIDSAPLQREYVTAAEIWLLKRMEPVLSLEVPAALRHKRRCDLGIRTAPHARDDAGIRRRSGAVREALRSRLSDAGRGDGGRPAV